MSASSVDPSSVASAIPDEDWECPQISPPPPPPSPPPLPVCKQTLVENTVYKDNILARPPDSSNFELIIFKEVDIEEEAEFELGVFEERARQRRFEHLVAHLPYSKVDWGISIQSLEAGGFCLIPEARCNGVGTKGKKVLMEKLRAHLTTTIHLQHEEQAANAIQDTEPPPREPKFVMVRTINIEFMDPPGLDSSPVSDDTEGELTTPVDSDRQIPDSQEDPFDSFDFFNSFVVPDSTADSDEDLG
ncbi:hypothetical protein FCULG_00007771 [Fusarium culmorum]|uniref:Uncharacterized protein n=1 Tax=Fusarium culmorum TaxID=5516 RepID=A0A2T4H1Z2_FUSCU|nr:hypothetical protein FCULG_00007771 [Fusarium culmorum]